MKKLFYIFSGFLALSLSSCNDFDVLTTDRLTDEKVWSDDKLISSAMAGLYDDLEVEHVSDYFSEPYWDVANVSLPNCSDEGVGAYMTDPLGASGLPKAFIGDEWFGLWKNTYVRIRACNVFLEKIAASTLDDNKKAAFSSEARYLRAFQYFTLVKRYGGVPLITQSQKYNGPDHLSDLQLPRNTEQEIYDFIIKEIDEIAPLLPATRVVAERARITRYGAYALQSRTALYAGSIAKYGTVQLGGLVGVSGSADIYWAKSIAASDSVIKSGRYALYNVDADKSTNFRNMFMQKTGNSEYIFWQEYQVGASGRTNSFDELYVPFGFVQKGYGCGVTPTLDLIETYEYIDGTAGVLKTTDNQGKLIKYSSPLDLFANKDPRFKASFYLPGDDCRGGKIEIRRGVYKDSVPSAPIFISKGNFNTADTMRNGLGEKILIMAKDGIWDTGDVGKTGFYLKKFADEGVTSINYNLSSNPWPVFRLAEIYLNRAEAAKELGGLDAQAQEDINMVRARAGIKLLDQSEVTLDRIRHERRVELAYEGHRFWDLRRWRIATTVLSNFESKALYPWLVWSDGSYVFTTKKADKPNKVFLDKNYYVRITDTDMSSNPRLKNNPYY